MLTGIHPFRRSRPVETMGAILHEEPEPLVEHLPGSTELLQETVSECWPRILTSGSKSIEEVANRLEPSLSSQAEELRLTAFLRSRLGRRLALALTAVVAIVLIGWWALKMGTDRGRRPDRSAPSPSCHWTICPAIPSRSTSSTG